MRLKKYFLLLPLTLVVVSSAFAIDTESNSVAEKLEYALDLKNKLYDISNEPKVAKNLREESVIKFLVSEMDVERMAKLSLGNEWRSFSKEQQGKFVDKYKPFLVHSLETAVKEAFLVPSKNVKMINKAIQINNLDHEISFRVKRQDENGSDFTSILVLTIENKTSADSKPKVVNISVDSVDIITGHKSIFHSAIEEGGIKAIFSTLEEEIKSN